MNYSEKILNSIIEELEKKEFAFSSGELVNVDLGSLTSTGVPLKMVKAAAKGIENMDQRDRFKDAVRKWSGERAKNPKLMTEINADGTIGINLLFVVK